MSDFNIEQKNISCESIVHWITEALEVLGQNAKFCKNGDVSISWIIDSKTIIETQKRAYQREKVSDVEFQQEIMRTVLVNKYTGIPEVHIRILIHVDKEGNMIITFELVDGQQRITSITDYLENKFALGKDMVIDGKDISGLKAKELEVQYNSLYRELLEYRISCKWYVGLTDSETAHNFIYVLNKVNDMKPQELRNALLGVYSTFIRETVRSTDKEKIHELFKRTLEDGKERLTHFSPNFALKKRMEVDEWLSELIYLWKHDPTKGISHKAHFNWVESSQAPNGEYGAGFSDEVKVKKLLSTAQSIITAVPAKYKGKLNPMTSMMLVLYGNKLKQEYGSLLSTKYIHAFFGVYERWSDINNQLYADRMMGGNKKPKNLSVEDEAKVKQMPPFNQLFGGKNAAAIGTIFAILEEEMLKDKELFGVIEIDQRNFKRSDVVNKWREQDCLCGYTFFPLDEDNIVGDHEIPRSQGGRTELDNLVVTSRELNLKKLNMSKKDFLKLVAEKKEEAGTSGYSRLTVFEDLLPKKEAKKA